MDQPDDYVWIVVLTFFGAIFAAFGIGANDVANAFGTSIGSKALTFKQAVCIAVVCEFAGALFMGSHVTKTIRKGIADYKCFEDNPEVLMYGCMCVTFAVGVWLFLATKYELPVSTTHSAVGGMIGMTLVIGGDACVTWDKPTDTFPYHKGVTAIVLSWILSPLFSATLAALFFAAIRTFVLRQGNSYDRAFWVYPALVMVTIAINVMFIIYKGAKGLGLADTSMSLSIGLSLGIGTTLALLTIPTLLPWMRRRIDERWANNTANDSGAAHALGNAVVPLAGPLPSSELSLAHNDGEEEATAAAAMVGNGSSSAAASSRGGSCLGGGTMLCGGGTTTTDETTKEEGGDIAAAATTTNNNVAHQVVDVGSNNNAQNTEEEEGTAMASTPPESKYDVLGWGEYYTKRFVTYIKDELHVKVDDIVKSNETTLALHANAEVFDEKTEDVFGYLQIFTAMCESFAHGANDVANSIGPLAAVWTIYSTNTVSKKSDMGSDAIWILAIGGVGIVFGLATYGYKIMQTVGVKFTKVTPTRGFAIELAVVLVIIVGSRLEIPLSTTHCSIGAIVGVGILENGSVDWRLFAKVCVGWVITLVVVGSFTAVMVAQGVYSPSA